MIALLLISALISQGIPLPASETGIVTGTLKTELGTPATGVRVGAMAKPESATDAVGGTALASIAETDAAGHFRLENIPPGRYYITAGRVDFPTFFPGTQAMASGLAILVKPGETISGIDFVMNSVAVRPQVADVGLGPFSLPGSPTVSFSVSVSVEDGSKVPVSSANGFTALQLQRTTDGLSTTMPLSTKEISVAVMSGPLGAPDYRITIQNLPAGYRVASIRYGATVLRDGVLRISTSKVTVPAIVTSPTGILTLTGSTIFPAGGVLPSVPSSTPPAGPSLSIALLAPPPTSAPESGVRVTGSAPTSEPRSVYLSGVPGIFYADGSFEFRNVKPGRYSIATPDNPLSSRPLAASVVVGNQDLDGVELVATPLLPKSIQTPSPPLPVGGRSSGFTIPQGVIQGLVLDESTHQPIPEGTVYLTGHYGGSRSLVPDGRFEFTRLLPGSYDLEVQIFGHDTIRRTIVIDDEDVTVDLSAAPIP